MTVQVHRVDLAAVVGDAHPYDGRRPRPFRHPRNHSMRYSDTGCAAGMPGGDASAGLETELGKDVRDVVLDGALRQVQTSGDLSVAEPLRNEGRNLFLQGREHAGPAAPP